MIPAMILSLFMLITLKFSIHGEYYHNPGRYQNHNNHAYPQIIPLYTRPHFQDQFGLVTGITNHGTTLHHCTVRILYLIYLYTIGSRTEKIT